MFLKRFKTAHAQDRVAFHGQLAHLNEPDIFAARIEPLYDKDWVVYAKRPFAGPKQVLEYLGRYTHRVGISNARIVKVTGRNVVFTYRDRKNAARKKTMTLNGAEFLRRFFLHVLPKGFTRIRHYGFLGNAVRKTNLPLIRAFIGQPTPEPVDETPLERIDRVYGFDLSACPCCQTGRIEPIREIPAIRCKGPP
jgi:hypothetical protein